MRIIALLILGLCFAAYRNLQPSPPQPSAPAASPVCQAGSIFFQSTNGGLTWQDISAGLPDTMNSLLAQDGEVYLGSANGVLYHSRQPEKGLWEQENLNESCQNPGEFFSNLGQALPNNMILNIRPGHPGPLVNIYRHGFFQQKPGSHVWQPMHGQLKEKMVHALLQSANGSHFIGAGTGIYKSTDQGKTWNQVYTDGWVSGLFEAGDAILGSSAKGLLQSTDGGEHWNVVLPDDRSNYEIFLVEGGVVAARLFGPWQDSYKANPLYISTDYGATWKPMAGALPAADHIDALVQAGNYLFCSYQGGIARSADGGKTWEVVYALNNKDKTASMQLAVSGNTVYAIVRRGGC